MNWVPIVEAALQIVIQILAQMQKQGHPSVAPLEDAKAALQDAVAALEKKP